MKLTEILNEIESSSSISQYSPKASFDEFQVKLTKIVDELKKNIKSKVLGREVSFRGAKGFGQIEQAHIAIVHDVDLVLYQDKYTILFKATEGKSKKIHEYYIDPTNNVYMKIKNGAAPTEDIAPEPKMKPQPVVQQAPQQKIRQQNHSGVRV